MFPIRGLELGAVAERAAAAAAPASPPLPYTPKPALTCSVFDPELGEFVEVAIREGRSLAPGARLNGPAIIVEDETSTVVTRFVDAAVDASGYIELTRRSGDRANPRRPQPEGGPRRGGASAPDSRSSSRRSTVGRQR